MIEAKKTHRMSGREEVGRATMERMRGSSSGASFLSSRRRYTRYWRDWSSDVCSSDLGHPQAARVRRLAQHRQAVGGEREHPVELLAQVGAAQRRQQRACVGPRLREVLGGERQHRGDRKSDVKGESGDLGGRRTIKKNR